MADATFFVCFAFVLQAALFAIDLLFEKNYERKPIFVRQYKSCLKSFILILILLTIMYNELVSNIFFISIIFS